MTGAGQETEAAPVAQRRFHEVVPVVGDIL
jgi:hypothetical protein